MSTTTTSTKKLPADQRKLLLQTGAAPTEIQMYVDEGYTFEEIQDFCVTAQTAKAEQARKQIADEAAAHALADEEALRRNKTDKDHRGHSHFNPAGGRMPTLAAPEGFWCGEPRALSRALTR